MHPPSTLQVVNLVVDPVMVSTSGHSLAGSEVGAALMTHLLPLAMLVTPNIPEASALLGETRLRVATHKLACELHSHKV